MKIKYRPEIDGLRAIAVFAVILYHANFVLFGYPLFQGGFIGVDIFFVISGYLITNLILKEIYKINHFSFNHFYERRIRRILPVLLFIIIVTSIVSYLVLLPFSLIDFAKSILSIILFGSNFYFWITGGRYGDESESIKPLVNTWSLSVEEQFYILFPIFLIIVIKFYKRKTIIILFFLFIASLISAEFFSSYNKKLEYMFCGIGLVFSSNFSFYFLHTRIFELIIGSFIAYFELNNGGAEGRKSYSILNQICPSLGIILILYSFLFFNFNRIFHPGFITLIPLIGVSLIIWFSKKGELITEILSSKIFVFFGLISYSLYLWHYPIFAFLRYIDIFNNSNWIKLLSILLTIILSIISYYLIERPFRNKNIISIKTLTTYILVSIFILLIYSFYILKTEGIKNRFENIFSEDLINPNSNKLEKDEKNIRDFRNHVFYATGFEKGIYLIGDSHASALKYYLSKEFKKNSFNFFSSKSIFYLNNFNKVNKKSNNFDEFFSEENQNINKFISENKDLIVIWSQRWTNILETKFQNPEYHYNFDFSQDKNSEYFEPIGIKTSSTNQRIKYLKNGIKLSANNILKHGHILILVYPTPELGFSAPNVLKKKYFINYYTKNIDRIPLLTVSYEVYKKRNQIIFDILDSIQGVNVYRVYPHESFCNTVIINRCVANNKEHLFYYDDNHLSLEGSKYVVNDIMKVIQQIEVNKKVKSLKNSASQN